MLLHDPGNPRVAVIDYGMGNLFSVRRACEYNGLEPVVTSDRSVVESAAAVILPGVGAFGDAIEALNRLGLVEVLRDTASSGKPFVGICLGMQLMMNESQEFGGHEGLRIIDGDVVRLDASSVKVPLVGWNAITPASGKAGAWEGTLLQGMVPGEFMYFVHSYYVRPSSSAVILSTTSHGGVDFCSTMNYQNIFACQFHPERSGLRGLHIYGNLAQRLKDTGNGVTS